MYTKPNITAIGQTLQELQLLKVNTKGHNVVGGLNGYVDHTESTQLSEFSGEGSHYNSQEIEIRGGTDLENQSESPSET